VRVALIQQSATADVAANRERGLAAARSAAELGAEVIVFAELAFAPFYPQNRCRDEPPAGAEAIPGPTTEAFAALARACGVVVVLNLFERAGAATFDASPVIDADGTLLGATRMVHITDYEGFHERDYYAPGDRGAPVYSTAAGPIGVAICYDRHYPEYMRALAVAGADLVVVPQAGAVGEWPAGVFEAEMQAAAFQNGYFVALCNRVGAEERLTFAGGSFVCDPFGRVVSRAAEGAEEILHVELDPAQLAECPARRLFLRDRRPELYGGWLG
jgi:N-carbamoylputrescine amidase